MFEDPCPDTHKYIEVHYKCMLGWSCTYDKLVHAKYVMSPCSARFDTASIIAISFLDNNAIDYFSDPVGNKSSCIPVLEVPAVAEHYTAPRTKREGMRPHQRTMHLWGSLLRNVALVSCVCR